MANANPGILDVRSHRSVPETIDRLQSLATARRLSIFGRIDYSGDAKRAGIAMRPMQMLVFGNPEAGTPLLAHTMREGSGFDDHRAEYRDVET